MSIPHDPPQPEHNELQFDQAEFAAGSDAAHQTAATTCTACKLPIQDAYYETGGKIVCEPCRGRLEAAFYRGSRAKRALKAFVFGCVGAGIGAVIYYGITQLTGLNIGLVAIVVGLLVGGAVKAGSGNRGGRFYQFLAVFLTYSAIAAMYIPDMIGVIRNGLAPRGEAKAAKKAADPKVVNEAVKPAPSNAKAVNKDAKPAPPNAKAVNKDAKPAPPKAQADPKAGEKAQEEETEEEDEAPAPLVDKEPVTLPKLLLAVALVFALFVAFAYSIPVLVAFQSPISGLIFCFALWEAWKINRGVRLSFNGPFRLAPESPQAPVYDYDLEEPGDER
jgi:hypothetical protein